MSIGAKKEKLLPCRISVILNYNSALTNVFFFKQGIKQGKQHDYENERGQNTHRKEEQVKMPLLPNNAGKRSGTTGSKTLKELWLSFDKRAELDTQG